MSDRSEGMALLTIGVLTVWFIGWVQLDVQYHSPQADLMMDVLGFIIVILILGWMWVVDWRQ